MLADSPDSRTVNNRHGLSLGRLSVSSRDHIALALLWLFHVASNLSWLWQDQRTPFADVPDHLTNAFRVADILAHPGLDVLTRLAEVSDVRPPFLYVVTAPFLWLFGRSDDVANLANQLFLAVLLFSTYGIGRLLFAKRGRWVGLAAAALLSFFPLVFTFARIYYADLALAGIVSLAIWFLLKSERFQQRPYAVAFGLTVAAGMLTKQMFFAFLLGPSILVGVQALMLPWPARSDRQHSSLSKSGRTGQQIRPASVYWNLLLALAPAAMAVPWYLHNMDALLNQASGVLSHYERATLLEDRGYSASFYWYLSFFDDALGGFFFLLLVAGTGYAVWKLLMPNLPSRRDASARKIRYAYGFLLVWLVTSYTVYTWVFTGHVRYMLPVMPVVALLSVAWLVDLSETISKQTRSKPAAYKWTIARWSLRVVMVLMILVGLTNYLIISWGAPPALAAALKTKPSDEFRPMHHTLNTPLFFPGRAIFHQYPPKIEDWSVATIVQGINEDCQQANGCAIIVLPCIYAFERRPFTYYAALQGVESRLKFRGLSQRPDYYRSLLDVDYLVGKTGSQGCGTVGARVEHLETILRLIESTSLPVFTRRFELINTYGPLPDGSTAWVLRRRGLPIDELPERDRRKMLEHVLEITPESARARRELTQLLRKTGNITDLIEIYEREAALAPEAPDALIKLARLYLADGQFRKAIDTLQAVLALKPQSRGLLGEIYGELGQAYSGLHLWEAAEEAYNQAVNAALDDPSILIAQGSFYEDWAAAAEGQIAERAWIGARKAYERAVELDPRAIQGYRGLARYYMAHDDIDSTLTVYRQGLKAVPNSPWLHFGSAEVYFKQGDYEAALPHYRKAIELLPDQAVFHFQLAQTYRRLEQWDKAAAEFAQAIRLNSGYANTLSYQYGIGLVELGRQHYAEAAEAFKRVLEIKPNHLAAHYYLGEALEGAGDPEGAREAYQSVLSRAPNSDYGQMAAKRLAQLGS